MAETLPVLGSKLITDTRDKIVGKTKKTIKLGSEIGSYYAGTLVNNVFHAAKSAAGAMPDLGQRFIEGATGNELYSSYKPRTIEAQIPTQESYGPPQQTYQYYDTEGYPEEILPPQDTSNYIPPQEIPAAQYHINYIPTQEIPTKLKNYRKHKSDFSILPKNFEKFLAIFLLALFIFSAIEFMAIPRQDECVKTLAQKIYIASLIIIMVYIPSVIFLIIFGYYNIIFAYILGLLYFSSILLMYIKSNCSYGDFRYIKIILLLILLIFIYYNKKL